MHLPPSGIQLFQSRCNINARFEKPLTRCISEKRYVHCTDACAQSTNHYIYNDNYKYNIKNKYKILYFWTDGLTFPYHRVDRHFGEIKPPSSTRACRLLY
jgi:hypothetical protein